MEDCRSMKLLLDTNVFLEVILDQERAPEAKTLLQAASKEASIN